jgi:CTP synthase
VPQEYVVGMPNVDTVYRIPETIAQSALHTLLSKFTGNSSAPDLGKWQRLTEAVNTVPSKKLTVGLVAKYMENEDTYLSVTEAIKAAGWTEGVGIDIRWINAEECGDSDFSAVDALVVPGGFGERGVEGKIAAATYALKHKKPYLGLCLGLQVAVIASARRAGLSDANSTEFNPGTSADVVYIMEGQEGKESTGGTLRLGDYPAHLHKGTLAAQVYESNHITERHRHRYEVNQKFTEDITKGGLTISGTSPDGKLVEFVEAKDHPYFLATQAHPEFKSRPFKAHPMFVGLIKSIS